MRFCARTAPTPPASAAVSDFPSVSGEHATAKNNGQADQSRTPRPTNLVPTRANIKRSQRIYDAIISRHKRPAIFLRVRAYAERASSSECPRHRREVSNQRLAAQRAATEWRCSVTENAFAEAVHGSRMEVGQRIRSRAMESVRAELVQVPDADRVVHLQFRRFAGCPICNAHLHSIVRRYDEIVAAGVNEVVVFHTSRAKMREHLHLPFHVIPDPERVLYKEFGVEPSPRAVFSWPFWPAALRGLMSPESRPGPATVVQGGPFGLPADFLVSPSGRILACKYGQHADDQWSVDEILSLVPRDAGELR